MGDEGYNGWKNYPTWAVHLWLTNDEGTYDECSEQAASVGWATHPRYEMAQYLKDMVRDQEPDEASLMSDLLGYALDCVDWYEIADAFLAEVVVPA